jgi:hypothetical protein
VTWGEASTWPTEGMELTTVTFTKDVYRFDAAGLRKGIVEIARSFDVDCVVVEETKKWLSVKLTFSATGTQQDLEDFAAAVSPRGGTGGSGTTSFFDSLFGG